LKISSIVAILDDTGGKYSAWMKENKIRLRSIFDKKTRDQYFYKIGFFSSMAMELEKAYESNSL